MRTIRFALVLVAVVAMAFAGVAAADCGSCGHGKAAGKGACLGKGDCPGFDKASMKTFKATVIGLEKESCKGCKMEHVDLVVNINDEKVKIRLGPAWYLDKQDELLVKDDVVEIVASKTKEGDKDFFVAGKITKGEDVLMLRDEEGLPMWKGWRRGKV